MESPNPYRIQSLTAVPTLERQTPNNDFGTVFARTTSQVLSHGSGLLSAVGTAVPVLSSAVAGASHLAASVSAAPSGVVSIPGASQRSATTLPNGSGLPLSGRGESWDLLEAQRLLQQEGMSLNAQYLGLQNEMQRESREFNAITNILKVRHDSAKAAINNIR